MDFCLCSGCTMIDEKLNLEDLLLLPSNKEIFIAFGQQIVFHIISWSQGCCVGLVPGRASWWDLCAVFVGEKGTSMEGGGCLAFSQSLKTPLSYLCLRFLTGPLGGKSIPSQCLKYLGTVAWLFPRGAPSQHPLHHPAPSSPTKITFVC